MSPADFDYVCRLVRDRSAIVLEPGKEYLVETRLAPIARQLGLETVAALIHRLRADPNGLATRVVEAMVTTESSFFRDHHPYETLRTAALPHLIDLRAADRRLSIWSAASSTGQEAYSLAILIKEHFPRLAAWDVRILATDLSNEVLDRARAGRFSQIEVNRGLPAQLLAKYFRQHGVQWELNEEIRRMVEFRQMNLATEWPPLPLFDLVVLRNVMIYFDVPTKKAILGRAARLLRPHGFLLLGGAETTFGLDDSFRRVDRLKGGFYQLGGASG
jgi:chemotaxis protein methyltransferase CheR